MHTKHALYSYSPSPNPVLTFIGPNNIWIICGPPDSSLAMLYTLSSPALSCPVNIKAGKKHSPRDFLCKYFHAHFTSNPATEVELVYAEQAMNTFGWKNSII